MRKSLMVLAAILPLTAFTQTGFAQAGQDDETTRRPSLPPTGDGEESQRVASEIEMTISGTVDEIQGDRLTLNTAYGAVTVEVGQQWPFLVDESSTRSLSPGDEVTVTGNLDDNYFSNNTLQAYRLTIDEGQLQTTYRAGSAREGADGRQLAERDIQWQDTYDFEQILLTGIIEEVNGENEVRLIHNDGGVTVNIADIDLSVRDHLGPGERVTFEGEVDEDWFGQREFDATAVLYTSVYRLVE